LRGTRILALALLDGFRRASEPGSFAPDGISRRHRRQHVDLTAAPFKRWRSEWTDPRSYTTSQHFAEIARQADVDAIRYESVRDPQHAAAVAGVAASCFKPRKPLEQRMWLLTVSGGARLAARGAEL